jgi:hypothetical protein
MRTLVVFGLLVASAVQGQPALDREPRLISVGPNVQISKPFPRLAHYENLAAGDPRHAGRLIACATVAHQELASQGYHCYVSFDAGRSWSTALEFDKGPRNSDPAVAYGRGDTVFVVNEYTPGTSGNRMEIYRSADGGKTWAMAGTFTWIDRQAIVIDETNGRYAGRAYVSGVSKGFTGAGGAASVVLYRSTDGGATWTGPVERQTVEGGGLLGASNNVVLSDGTLAFTTFHIKKDRALNIFDENNTYRSGNAELQLLTSSDGGESLNPWTTISDAYIASAGAQFAQLGLDPGSRYFKDRLYVVWPDAAMGRVNIRFVYSSDSGKSWSVPSTVNDDRPPAQRSQGPDHMLPAIGVNKDGVVLVTWYDRRESPDNTGWTVRAAASLDGGVTFTPSVVVSEASNAFTDRTAFILNAPNVSGGGTRRAANARARPLSVGLGLNSFFMSGGDTDGMAVGADGVFHAIWVDNRTGVSQLWTAPVTVHGTVERHGAAELADLDDVTNSVTLEPQSTRYDRATNTLAFVARLRNNSSGVLHAPVKARLIGISSQLGAPVVVGAANGVGTVGAIWDLSGSIPPRGLLPDSVAAPATFSFRLHDLRAVRKARQSSESESGLVRFDTAIYGHMAR